MTKQVYCLCGLGSDERIFSKLNWNKDWNIHYLHWMPPQQNEAISDYALRMCSFIHTGNSTLIGVSFGGMLCIEIAKHIPVDKVILISSVQSYHELPGWMRVSGKLKLDALIPGETLKRMRPLKFLSPIENYFLGATTSEEKQLAEEYRKDVDPGYLKWAIHQILNWKNEWIPPLVYHLHGDKDKILPLQNIKSTHVISGGHHFMVYSNPQKISTILEEII
ncbi:MAG: alpha/beta hydrolase [Bacteroidetes bacterium]|nr:alpha/beta hydrolase [Bacteroidota bacterium]